MKMMKEIFWFMAIQIVVGFILLIGSLIANLILNRYLFITKDMLMPASFFHIIDALKFTFRLVFPSLAVLLLGASIRILFILRCVSKDGLERKK